MAAWLTGGPFQLSVAVSQIVAKLSNCALCSISQAALLRARGSVSKAAFRLSAGTSARPENQGLCTWRVLPRSSGGWVPRMSIPKEKAR